MDLQLRDMIKNASVRIKSMAGQELLVLHEENAREIANQAGSSLREVFKTALMQDIVPYRYLRNGGIISCKDQLVLAESTVAVIGAGGLGGQVILLLARTGIGKLVVIDSDRFDETNLNRQALCTMDCLGKSKALEAGEKVREINPAVEVEPHEVRLTPANSGTFLKGVHVIVDALDNVVDRFVLERVAKALRVPMVHAGIAGFEGQVMTIYPEDPGLALVYGDPAKWGKARKTPEALLGVPAVTASLVATLEAMEVLKILLGKGEPMRNRLLRPDLETGEFHQIMFA